MRPDEDDTSTADQAAPEAAAQSGGSDDQGTDANGSPVSQNEGGE